MHDFGVNFKNIRGIKIPDNGFDKLIDFVETIGYDLETINLIIDNIPNGYDLCNLL